MHFISFVDSLFRNSKRQISTKDLLYIAIIVTANSSVRRIFEKGGPGNLKIMKTKSKISLLRISPFFGPKLGEDQKKKEKGLH